MKNLILLASLFCSSVMADEEATKGLDREKVRTVIRDHLRDVRTCYETALKTDKSISGKVIMDWEVGVGGKVTKVSTFKSLHPQVDKCLEEKIKAWKFPEPPTGQNAKIRYPFVFSET